MATNNRGGDRQRNRARTGRNNNPEGRNQYSGLTGAARANPLAAAAAVGTAVATGVFLWSRRGQISDQIDNLSAQVNDWRARSESDFTGENLSSEDSFIASSSSRSRSRRRSQAEIAQEALTLKEIGEAH